MYYIVEKNYVGPNQHQDQYIDADTIEIRTAPETCNLSGEICLEGWCGTTKDWAIYAYGEYESLEAARVGIVEKFSEVRLSDPGGIHFNSSDPTVVEICKPGKYKPMTPLETRNWTFESMQEDIQADTSDERIDQLIEDYQEEANRLGYLLNSGLRGFMDKQRQELKEG